MNANYDAVVSLVSLLVKKAGFDISKNYSEEELEKTKRTISELNREKSTSNNKKALISIIDNLKVRQANWENNAEVVGKSILKAYEEGKDYNSVKMRIELLYNLAIKGTSDITVGAVYDDLKSLELKYEDLLTKIESTDYRNIEEREMDVKYQAYLENKLESLDNEIGTLDSELESLRQVEIKDVGITTKLKDYVAKLKTDLDKINNVLNSSINSDIAFDVWERLETAKNETDEKYDKATELLKRTESMLEDVKKNRDTFTERKKRLEEEKSRCKNKFNNINIKLEEDNYENKPRRMIDENNSEVMRLKLESLRNKKDVIYVDALKVKEELIREWNKPRSLISEKPVERPPKQEPTVKPRTKKVVPKVEEPVVDIKEEKTNDIIDDVEKEIEILEEEHKEISNIQEEPVILKDENKNKEVEIISDLLKDIPNEMVIEDKTVIVTKPKEEALESNNTVKNKKNKIELDW